MSEKKARKEGDAAGNEAVQERLAVPGTVGTYQAPVTDIAGVISLPIANLMQTSKARRT